jgi:hypothetical protein
MVAASSGDVAGRFGAGALVTTRTVAFRGEILAILQQLAANGASSVEGVLSLPKNAVVQAPFTVTVQAGRAEWTRCRDVGQLRQQDRSAGGQARTSVVVDFGVLRTVAGVGVKDTEKYQVLEVKPWNGTAFAEHPIFSDDSGSAEAAVIFDSQVRTERLQIELIGKENDSILGDWLLVQLPDPPADLELRIDGGRPVWTSPGPVVAGARGWQAPPTASGLLYQEIDLSVAINALLGDPAAVIVPKVDLHLVLSARLPGALQLDLPPENARRVRYLARPVLAPGQDQLVFAEEGRKTVPLALPAWVQSIDKVALTVAAKLAPERTVPPLGPDAEPAGPGSTVPLAEMLLDPARAGAVALATATSGAPPADPRALDLGELVAVRLPLRAEAGGAEVRALLLGGAAEPGAAISGGTSKPVELQEAAGAAAADAWSTFAFPRPVPLDPGRLPFVAVMVTRGRVRWSLTGAAAGQVFSGPPDGPWQPLPALGDVAALGGRVRMVGHAAPDRQVAPLEVRVAGVAGAAAAPAAEVTPTPKGVAVEVQGAAGVSVELAAPALEVLSLVAGTVTVSNVVVTATRRETTTPAAT